MKLIPTLRNKKYEDRLRETELFTMSHRRFRGDLIQVYKIFNKLDNVDLEPLLELSQTGLRSNGLKIVQRGSRSDLRYRKGTFQRRVPKIWNKLPSQVVGAENLRAFKQALDRHQPNGPPEAGTLRPHPQQPR